MCSSGGVIPWATYHQSIPRGLSLRKEQHVCRDKNILRLSYSPMAAKNSLELRYDSFIDAFLLLATFNVTSICNIDYNSRLYVRTWILFLADRFRDEGCLFLPSPGMLPDILNLQMLQLFLGINFRTLRPIFRTMKPSIAHGRG